ncbi:hypothetical protein SAMN05216266_10456 [Amycolatopsis marina]|uniref:Uncharacterized protein n=1 Tax=Amycolatopsis marina TaxID=490629 RepID=A0A1I0XWW2_9PSEU|nr:hypothetical protein [Amycolatopsis marina]SFB05137.1 hypothetical protein SAMN05216266_10456 [Amycolatopsis marina]
MNRLLIAGRVAAVAVSVPTFLYLFPNDRFRSDNLFLVPDLVLCVVLIVGAFLPARQAVPVLGFGFAFAGGVIGTAVSSYVARGSFNIFTALIALVCLVMGVLLVWHGREERSGLSVPAP